VYEKLREELDGQLTTLRAQVAELYGRDSSRAESETQTARLRLTAAENSSIEASVHAGFITTDVAAKLLDSVDKRVAVTPNPQTNLNSDESTAPSGVALWPNFPSRRAASRILAALTCLAKRLSGMDTSLTHRADGFVPAKHHHLHLYRITIGWMHAQKDPGK
jgi:hypothetical protein